MPAISVIVPVYNAAPYLTDCVNSILSQSFQDFELLLVDDGSTDESPKICDELAASDSRIRVFHKKNGGVSSARNKGLEEACGQWIYFCDADDIVLPNGLSIMMDLTSHVEMVMAGYCVYNDQNICTFECQERVVNTLNKVESLSQMLVPTYFYYQGYLWNKLFKKQEIDRMHLCFDEAIRCNEDRLFITKYLAGSQGRMCYTTTPVYKYNQRSSGAMNCALSNNVAALETDFDASILMFYEIKTLQDSNLLDLFRQGVFSSFLFVTKSVAAMNLYQKKIRRRLTIKLIRTVGFQYWILWKIGIYKIRIIH